MNDCFLSFAGSRGSGVECDRLSAVAVAVAVDVATGGAGAAGAGAGAGDSFLDDPKTRRKNPGRSLGGLGSAGGGGGGKEGKAGLLNEMVGLGAGGSIVSIAGGGFSAISDSTFRITDRSRFSGRDFFFFGFGRDDDRVLFFREAIVAIDGWGFRELTWSDGDGDWYLLGPAGTLGVGAASRELAWSDGDGD